LDLKQPLLFAYIRLGDRAGLTDGARFGLADCLIGAAKVDAKAVTELSGDPNWSANLNLALGEIALRRGDRKTSRAGQLEFTF
jgi:hypothetical protein